MRCALCGRDFEPDEGQEACRACALVSAGCGKARCPHCGYENQRPLRDAWSALRERWRGLTHGSSNRH